MPKGDSTPSPWFHFLSGFKSYPRPAKKKTIVQPQVQETVIEPNKTFGAEQTEWCETAELVMPLIVKEAKKEEMTANLRAWIP